MPHKQLQALYYDVLKYAFGTGASEHIQVRPGQCDVVLHVMHAFPLGRKHS